MMPYGRIAFLSSLIFIAACGGKKEETAAPAAATESSAVQSPVDAATAATVTGSVKFTGTKPKAKKIQMSADAFCKTQHATAVDAEDVVVNPNGTLKNVYVYVKSGLGDLKFPAPSQAALLDQVGCTYHPHVLAVQAGQEIAVRNSDGVLHNVNARPKNNQGFNIGQPVKGMENKKSFANAEVMIPVKCDVHPWMGGYIGVQNHPYAAVSDDSGAFNFANLPPGTYEIEAWHEVYGTSVQTVTVGAKESKAITFTFKG